MKTKHLLLSSALLMLLSSSISSHTSNKVTSENTDANISSTDDISDQQETSQSQTVAATEPDNKAKLDEPVTLAKLQPIHSTSDNNASIVNSAPDQISSDEKDSSTVINTQHKAAENNTESSAESGTKTSEILQTYFSDEELAEQRKLFLRAEDALNRGNHAKYFLLSDKLSKYPLYPYLQYQWLKSNLNHERQVKHFLSEYHTSRYATKLQSRWLKYLGKNKKWDTFLEHYNHSNNTKLQCYYHQAQYNTGNTSAALNGAVKLWSVGYSQPRVCDPLFNKLKKSDVFTTDLLWKRFDAALSNNKSSLAKYVKRQMTSKNQKIANQWLKLHSNPARYLPGFLKQKKNTHSANMFSHAINRLSRKDINKAIAYWDSNKTQYSIDKKRANKLEKRLALRLALSHENGAYERLNLVDNHDNSSRTWRVRSALLEQDWEKVLTALHGLSNNEKRKEKWQYWFARAYLETDQAEKAGKLLTALSTKRSYYGYLAADKINSMYQLSNNPVDVSIVDITALKSTKEFRVAYELMVLERKMEAKLQWWHAVKQLNKQEILVAAKLAQQWQWDEIAIFTIAKAKHWDDIEVRFPLSYADSVHKQSIKQNLNPAIVFGLIRRESAFNERAHSPAGARGLMQIMPATGRQIARDFNERWKGNNSLYNPLTNLKYGSYYYQKLLNQFDGNYALALAAYNAGPNNVKKWLPEESSLPADIWIETIPFHETRDYVATVIAYALIYQQRTNDASLTMRDLTKDILPADISKQKI